VSRIVKIVLVLVVLGVAALGGVYLLFFNEDSPDEFTLTPVEEQEEPAAASSLDGTWTVADGSEAGYRVREKLANLPAQSDAVGRTPDVTGTVTIEDATVTAADFEVDVTTLTSDEDRRDNRIRTSGLESDRFPTATFTLTAPIDIGDADAATATVDAVGNLTIHGVTRSVTIPIEAARNGALLELVGSITFPFSDFDMTAPSVGGFVTVEDDATLEFKILLEAAA
jgi:polyisoprenoid-binding protein YceI